MRIKFYTAAILSAIIAQFGVNVYAMLVAPWYGKILALLSIWGLLSVLYISIFKVD